MDKQRSYSHSNLSQSSDLFELLSRLQSSRLDDQRCIMPPRLSSVTPLLHHNKCHEALKTVLRGPKPYPLIIHPPSGGYWIEPCLPPGSGSPFPSAPPPPSSSSDLYENSARTYRAHFLGYEHYNFCAEFEPVVMSLKMYGDQKDENHIRVIVRTSSGTIHKLISYSDLVSGVSPLKIMNFVQPEHSVNQFVPILCPSASELIMKYDEHLLVNHNKFGIVYQKVGQTTEEALFGNKSHCPAMETFLNLLGKKVMLSSHKGYRGGLDTQYGQTGKHSYFETFQGREIMFHVSTLLPYTDNDPQQLQRKRHIGNDIVAIIFQEGETPFSPDMITSHFLHAYIVVRPVQDSSNKVWYKIATSAKIDVPYFGPRIPSKLFDGKGSELKEFLLTKLINAEAACFKADKFSALEHRTRHSLLSTLHSELLNKTELFIDSQQQQQPQSLERDASPGPKLLSTVRKALKKNHNKLARLSSKSSVIHTSSSSEGPTAPDYSSARLLTLSKITTLSSASSSSDNGTQERIHPFDSGHGSGYGSSPDLHRVYSDEDLDDDEDMEDVLEDEVVGDEDEEDDETDVILMNYNETRISIKPNGGSGIISCGRKKKKKKKQGGSRLDGNSVIQHVVGSRPPIQGSGNQELVSGHVTMISVEGDVVVGTQLDKLKNEISKLRSDKLEIIRRNVEYRHELRRLVDRERTLASDLQLAGQEIQRLRKSISPALPQLQPVHQHHH
ncbi:rap1 GTPase-activating protein 1 [Lepeophtheirus salmonis]|uniref:Rap1 GTPaseactivating protein 1like [Acyrthosiphon pisum] n=1 Tax=Lepeophtheirus salmonis TaxID=72036 RepID=A0A0K2T1C4_LEPSM|nr:rap1 GTPase-activating protein 1-like [Lepeophtheirus salmonis]